MGVRYLSTLCDMQSHAPESPPASWDVVQSSERAGVRVTWLRRRDGTGANHLVAIQPLDGEEQGESLGPFDRKQAALVYDATQGALLVAARQQRARLRQIMDRRTRAAEILAGR